MNNLLTINEFAKVSGIKRSTLRYWEEIGLLSPTERDLNNGYRYYSTDQILVIDFITILSNLGISLKVIGEIMHKRTPQNIEHLIVQQEKVLDMEMRRLRECYSIIHSRLTLIKYGTRLEKGYKSAYWLYSKDSIKPREEMYVDEHTICVQHFDAMEYIISPRNEYRKEETFLEPLLRFRKRAKELRINLDYPIGGYYNDMDAFVKRPCYPDYFISLDPIGNRTRKAGKYLIGAVRGFYSEFGDLPERMAAYAKENSLTLTGPVYNLYLFNEICTKESSQYLKLICVAILE